MKKRILSILLAICIGIGLMPTAAFADADPGIAAQAVHYTHCICGGNVTTGDHTSHSDADYTAWNGTNGISYTNNTAYVYLTGNATLKSHLTVDGKTLYLCLNGKTLSSNGTAKIQVKNGGRLVLCDCQGGGTIKGATKNVWGGGCVYLYTSTLDLFGGKLTGGKVTGSGGGGAIALDDQRCVFNMYGGEISGNNGNNYGGAIYRKFDANKPNTTGGAFNMYGGVIKNNTAKNGGAFFSTTGGTVNLEGGTISGNTATMSSNDAGGGAIYMRGSGTINISDNAEITGNSSSLDGGAILMGWGTVNISGNAKLTGNTASRWGGAICLRRDADKQSTINMTGGEISGNRATKEGGAVHLVDANCTFNLGGGKITGNTSVDGGAIYLNQEPSVLNMTGGEISGNTATGSGGGVYIYRTGSACNLSGGKIISNTATGNGGGIYINPSNSGKLNLSGAPVVKDNTVSGKKNNVYLSAGKTLTIADTMADGASVGITTASTNYPVVFSNAYGTDYTAYFTSDDAGAEVVYQNDQKLYLDAIKIYTAKFDANTDDDTVTGMPADMQVPAKNGTFKFNIPTTVPTRAGYHFKWWSQFPDGHAGNYAPGDDVMIRATESFEQTYYAIWEAHADNNKDHKCDVCGKTLSDHVDDDKNHVCDICEKAISNHADDDDDHVCDICEKVISNHADDDDDHICDICGKAISNHADDDNNHICDICGKVISNHADDDDDHVCDICGKVISNHADDDNNHICDICGKAISNHADDDDDHVCDICGKVISNHAGGTATCKDPANCEICGMAYGERDAENHTNLVHFPAKAATKTAEGNIEYWYCDGCGKYYSDAAATKEITKADTVTKKLPDNGNPPPTGGRSSLALWMALLFVSGGAVIGAKAGDRKRKSNG